VARESIRVFAKVARMLVVARARLRRHHHFYREEERALITIHLSADDLARVRMALSPLWETVCSFGVLTNPNRHSCAVMVTYPDSVLGDQPLSPRRSRSKIAPMRRSASGFSTNA
jgi:hypothetical protein